VSLVAGRKSLAYNSSRRTTLLREKEPWSGVFVSGSTNFSTMPSRSSLLRGVMPRLESFLQPFVDALRTGTTDQARTTSRGAVGPDGKMSNRFAYLHDRERQGLQKFIGRPSGSTPLADGIDAAGGMNGEPMGVGLDPIGSS